MKLQIPTICCTLLASLSVLFSCQAVTLVDVLVAHNLTTLVSAAVTAGLDVTLVEGNYTIFAPTDEAFSKLPNGTLDSLMIEKNLVMLQDILLYHVAEGAMYSANITDGQEMTMLNGDNVVFSVSGDMDMGDMGNTTNMTIMVNDAEIIMADIMADNGVVHVIDMVLMPPNY